MDPSISSAENWFWNFMMFMKSRIHVEPIIYLFFNYYPVEKRLEQRYFFKKVLCMSYMVFLYKSGPIENPYIWVDNVEVIHYKKAWNWGWRPSFDDSWVKHFCSFILWNKTDHKKYDFALVLYLSRDISYFKS